VSRYTGFRCYYRSPRGRLVPARSGHYYANGMHPSRDAARAAAEREAAALRHRQPEKHWQVYEV
jgi:hypothetical protein